MLKNKEVKYLFPEIHDSTISIWMSQREDGTVKGTPKAVLSQAELVVKLAKSQFPVAEYVSECGTNPTFKLRDEILYIRYRGKAYRYDTANGVPDVVIAGGEFITGDFLKGYGSVKQAKPEQYLNLSKFDLDVV